VGEVVLAVEDGACVVELPLEQLVEAKLGGKPGRHSTYELGEGLRKGRHVADEHALEFHERLVVEGHRVDVGGGDSRFFQAVVDRLDREVGVVLLAREELL